MPITVEGTLPLFTTPKNLLFELARLMANDIYQDVDRGGSPQWKPTVMGKKAKLNYISMTLKVDSGDNYAEVSWGDGLIYAKVHERGMNIPKSPAMRRAIWAKLSKLGLKWDGIKRDRLIIPARPIIPGVTRRRDKYVKFIGTNLIQTEHIPIIHGSK